MWTEEEVLFHEIQKPSESIREKSGFKKIAHFCDLARSYQYGYAWVDTACIDKSSSAGLSEAINSMYKWYGHAGLCISYLGDVSGIGQLKDY